MYMFCIIHELCPVLVFMPVEHRAVSSTNKLTNQLSFSMHMRQSMVYALLAAAFSTEKDNYAFIFYFTFSVFISLSFSMSSVLFLDKSTCFNTVVWCRETTIRHHVYFIIVHRDSFAIS